eukprot:m.113476 g.113476  ORF g.113476 m.113476 type:complete len:106 (+) comp13021_c0_seq5:2840-3157(+)
MRCSSPRKALRTLTSIRGEYPPCFSGEADRRSDSSEPSLCRDTNFFTLEPAFWSIPPIFATASFRSGKFDKVQIWSTVVGVAPAGPESPPDAIAKGQILHRSFGN